MITTTPIPVFLFYLVNALGQSYYIDGNGLLQKSGLPAPLAFSPDGWQGIIIGWERNLQKFGLVRNFTLELGFVGDGALILEMLLDRGNPDEKVWLLVQKLELEVTDTDYAITHRFYYKGEIDYSTYNHVRRRVNINIMEGGRTKEIAANQSTTYNIPITDNPKKIRVKLDSLNFQLSQKYLIASDFVIEVDAAFPFVFAMPIAELQADGAPIYVAFFGQEMQTALTDNNVFSYVVNSQNYFCKVSESAPAPIDLNFQGSFKMQVVVKRTVTDYKMVLWQVAKNATPTTGLTQHVILSPFALPPFVEGEIYTLPINVPLTAQPGDRFFLTMDPNPAASPSTLSDFQFVTDSSFVVSFKNRNRDTFIYCLKPKDTFAALVEKISGDPSFAVSTLLDGSGICTTSGDAIRGLAGSFIKTTLQIFTDAWSIIKCAGIGVENGKIVLERRSHFLREDYVVDLGEIKDHADNVATDIMFNNVQYGYVDQNYSDVNGRYEVNSTQQRDSPVQRISKTLNLISQIRADFIGIALLQQNLDGKLTTDSNSDNDTFFLNVDLANPQNDDQGVYYKLKRVAYTSISGIPADFNVFNIEELTPRRIFKEWEPYFAGCFSGYTGKMRLTDFKKNKDLVTTGGPGGTFAEAEDVIIENMGTPLFTNRELAFTAVTKSSQVKQLNDNPWALFRYTKKGIPFKGFLLKGSVMSKTNEQQAFVLVSHKDNDLTLLQNE